MALGAFKRQLANFLQWHTVQPLSGQLRDLLFQSMVQRDLARFGVVDDFYPLGGAASYALLYLLIRLLRENQIETTIELGSGESTRLIDRVKRPGTRHVCYENDPAWYERTRTRLASCDYRLRPLRDYDLEGVEYRWYESVESESYDLLVVDGPVGAGRLSRIGCWQLIESNRTRDYVIVMDDSTRPGEQSTIDYILRRLAARGDNPVFHRLESGNFPAVICSGRFQHVRFY